MKTLAKNLVLLVIGASLLAFTYQYFSGSKALQLGNNPDAAYIQNDLDSLSAEYTKLSSELYKVRIALYEANTQLAQADSARAGGKFIYLVTFRCTDINVELANTKADSTDHAFDIVLPVTRDFYNTVSEGNVLQAGVNYGFIYGDDVLYGKNISVFAKTTIKDGTAK